MLKIHVEKEASSSLRFGIQIDVMPYIATVMISVLHRTYFLTIRKENKHESGFE